jgi:hypothetical protein
MERQRERELGTIDEGGDAHLGRPPTSHRPTRRLGLGAALVLVAVCACGGSGGPTGTNPYAGLPPDVRPRPVGPGPAYRPPPVSAAVGHRAGIDGLGCLTHPGRRFGIHLELFAHRFVVHIPAGIGIAPPQRRRGAYVLGGVCSYPLRTVEPTGVFDVSPGRGLHLGTLFAVWGERLARRRLLGFRGSVVGFVNGRRWTGQLAAIPLRRHAEIVLEVDGELPPHPSYEFAPGL